MFLINSRLGLFTAAHSHERPFSRSYGAILPSSLTRVLPRAFVFSTRPPVSVFGTGTLLLARGFSWQCDICRFGTVLPSPSQLMISEYGFACTPHSLLGRPLPSGRSTLPPASPHRSSASWWYWNLNQLSFDYASRPRLRSRLTLGGRSFPRNPWAFGGQDSHLSFRYLYRHSHFHALHQTSQFSFTGHGTLPYHIVSYIQSFGVRFSPVTFSAQRHSTSELLRTL